MVLMDMQSMGEISWESLSIRTATLPSTHSAPPVGLNQLYSHFLCSFFIQSFLITGFKEGGHLHQLVSIQFDQAKCREQKLFMT